MPVKFIYLAGLGCMIALQLFGQKLTDPPYEYPYQIYTVKDGLSQGQVIITFQESRGFLWAATKEGVDRFDGKEFLTFRDDSLLIEDAVSRINENEEGEVWFSGRKAAYRYDGKGIEEYPWGYRYVPPIIFFENGNVIVKKHDSALTYHFTDNHELERREFHVFPAEMNPVYNNIELVNNEIFIVSFIQTNNEKQFYLHKKKGDLIEQLAKDSLIMVIYAYPKGNNFYLIGKTIFEYAGDSLQKTIALDLPGYKYPFLFNNKLYVILNSSIYTLDDKREFSQIFHCHYLFSKIILNDRFCYLDTDRGLIKIFMDSPFLNYTTGKGMPETVWSIMEDNDGNMWFGSFSDKKIARLANNKFEYLDFLPSRNFRFYPGAIKTSTNEMWFPTDIAIVIINKDEEISTIETGNCNYLYEYENKIYVAGNGLIEYHGKKLGYAYNNEDGLDMEQLGYLEVIGMDTSGLMWLGSHLGLATWDGKEFKNYYIEKDIPAGIMAIKKDARGNLWFGTHGGLSFYDYTTALPKPVEQEQFKKSIKFIEFIDTSYILLGGSGELYLLDLPAFYKGKFELYTFTEEDGFSGEECLQNASFTDSRGHIWIGTTNGVVRFDPKKIKFYDQPTEPHFSYISYQLAGTDSTILHRVPYGDRNFSFSATSSDQNFEFKFYTINHDKPESITYRHRLKNFEENWSLARSPRFVSYSNLPVGEYEFELQSCIGKKCSETKSIHLSITPSLLLEYFFVKLFIGFLGAALVFLVLRQWMQQRLSKKRTEKLEQEKIELELKELKMRKNLVVQKVNPHFTFNVLNAISDLIRRQETQTALTYTAKFANLFRPLLANEGNLFRSLKEELKFIEDYIKLEQLRFPEKFNYSKIIAPNVDLQINMPVMVIHSFVNNAIKHGMEPLDEGGVVKVEILQSGDYITAIVSDNGIGRVEAERRAGGYHSGEGIKIVQDILNYLNEFFDSDSSIKVEDLYPGADQNSGTKVTLNLYAKYPNQI